MKIIKKTYRVYTFEELSQEAKDKAREKYNENNDYPFLTDDLREYIYEELTEKGFTIVGVSTSENPSIRPLYSLGYSQGDGLMFEGTIQDKEGNTYTIKQSGHYTHERSTTMEGTDKDGEEIDTMDFQENVYIPICKKVRDRGYEVIEYQDSEEYFTETCDANKYTFLEDGTMFNE